MSPQAKRRRVGARLASLVEHELGLREGFPQFCKLPVELRLNVWRQCIEPRALGVTDWNCATQPRDVPLPTAILANREACDEILKHYILLYPEYDQALLSRLEEEVGPFSWSPKTRRRFHRYRWHPHRANYYSRKEGAMALAGRPHITPYLFNPAVDILHITRHSRYTNLSSSPVRNVLVRPEVMHIPKRGRTITAETIPARLLSEWPSVERIWFVGPRFRYFVWRMDRRIASLGRWQFTRRSRGPTHPEDFVDGERRWPPLVFRFWCRDARLECAELDPDETELGIGGRERYDVGRVPPYNLRNSMTNFLGRFFVARIDVIRSGEQEEKKDDGRKEDKKSKEARRPGPIGDGDRDRRREWKPVEKIRWSRAHNNFEAARNAIMWREVVNLLRAEMGD